jgi:hypothetical protein
VARNGDHQRVARPWPQPVHHAQQGCLAAGALGHLAGQFRHCCLLELRLEVGEQTLPSHGPSLSCPHQSAQLALTARGKVRTKANTGKRTYREE